MDTCLSYSLFRRNFHGGDVGVCGDGIGAAEAVGLPGAEVEPCASFAGPAVVSAAFFEALDDSGVYERHCSDGIWSCGIFITVFSQALKEILRQDPNKNYM